MKKISARAYFFKKLFDCFLAGILIVFLIAAWMLYKGPISVPYLKPYIIQALNYDENEYQISIGDVNIELVRSIQPLRITAEDISVEKKDEKFNLSAPKLYMSFSLKALMKGIIAPSDISVINPRAYISASYGVEAEHKNEVGKKKLQFYLEKFREFLDNYNSDDKIYPESFVDNIDIKSAEIEFREVDFERSWILSDVNLEFSRNLINLEFNSNALVNLNDKIASVGFEGEYHAADDILDMEIYFSDLILSDFISSFNETTEDNIFSTMNIEIPVNGKIETKINLSDMLQHPDEVESYIDAAIEKINFEIDGGHGYLAFSDDDKYNYEIDEMQLSGQIIGGLDEIRISDAEFRMGGQEAKLNFYAGGLQTYYLTHSLQDTIMRLEVRVPEFPLGELSRFWPRYLAEPAWQWCKEGLTGGNAQNGYFRFDFGYNRKTDSWGLLYLDGKAYLSDGDLFYLQGMPVVHNLYGTANFSTQNISIDIDKGTSDGVMITGGNVNIYDLDKDDNFISIKLIGNSSVTDALKLIDNPPLNLSKGMGLEPESIKGDVDVRLNMDFELRQDLNSDDLKVKVDADLHNIEMKELLPEHIISAEQMELHVDTSGWNLTAEGKYDTMPISFKMAEKFAEKKYKSKCKLSFMLDKAAREVLGVDWKILNAPHHEGYAIINADVTVKENNNIEVDVIADLQNSKLNYPYLGLMKEYGQPANVKAHVLLNKDKISKISQIELIKPGFSVKGDVFMYPSGRFKLVDIQKIEGPKTSAKAKINLTDSDKPQIKVDISGSSYELTALFDKSANEEKKSNKNKITIQENEDDGLESVNNIDAFISVNRLWTNRKTPIENFAGSVKLRTGIGIDEIHMVGNYGIDKSIKLNLDYAPRNKNEHYLSIDSNNAGSTLTVLHLYDNMVGGTLKIEARRGPDKKFIGHAIVRDFSIQNAPVVAKLLTVASFTGMLDLLKGDGLTFTHFSAPFEYHYKTLKLKHAKAEGNVVGLTASGTYNRATDNIDLHGVIAPAYSLNRFLGKIPVVGNLLASKDGTIFAADYDVKGTSDDADVDVNSLSILSPNSMKEWYNENFGDGDEL